MWNSWLETIAFKKKKRILSWYFQWPHPAINCWMNPCHGKCHCNNTDAAFGVRTTLPPSPQRCSCENTSICGMDICVCKARNLLGNARGSFKWVNKCMKSSSQHTEVRVLPSFPENLTFQDYSPLPFIYNFIFSNAHWTSPALLTSQKGLSQQVRLHWARRTCCAGLWRQPAPFWLPHNSAPFTKWLFWEVAFGFQIKVTPCCCSKGWHSSLPCICSNLCRKMSKVLWHRLSHCCAFLYAPKLWNTYILRHSRHPSTASTPGPYM